MLGFCNSPQMNAIEAYIQFNPGLITDDGKVTNEGTEKFLKSWIDEFASLHRPGLHRAAPHDLRARAAQLVSAASDTSTGSSRQTAGKSRLRFASFGRSL